MKPKTTCAPASTPVISAPSPRLNLYFWLHAAAESCAGGTPTCSAHNQTRASVLAKSRNATIENDRRERPSRTTVENDRGERPWRTTAENDRGERPRRTSVQNYRTTP